eukprot:TRINITY_DN25392_c0_g1_i1.p1 TRINITY_DN25392_c0_g1~~TRINITY_DN25392_c0_g1_i1.p1  ORF type:complete len:384 (-),score=55.02 TRINITY_DN25392_c0_g1_i1:176-1327(-)
MGGTSVSAVPHAADTADAGGGGYNNGTSADLVAPVSAVPVGAATGVHEEVARRVVILNSEETNTLLADLVSVEDSNVAAVGASSSLLVPAKLDGTAKEPIDVAEPSAGHIAATSTGSDDDCCEVYYDTDALALTLLGWWLWKDSSAWHLFVPISDGRFEEVRDPATILERVGLLQSAAKLRADTEISVEHLLSQVGVRPFVRFSRVGEQTVGRLPSPERSSSATAGSTNVEREAASIKNSHEGTEVGSASSVETIVSIQRIHFDAQFAESNAVAELVFALGDAAPSALDVSVAEFRAKRCRADVSGNESLEPVCSVLFDVLRRRGLERFEPPRSLCPRLLAYLWALRPSHLRALTRAGAVPPWTWPGHESAVPLDRPQVMEVE